MAVTQSPTRRSPSRSMSFDKKMRGFLKSSLSNLSSSMTPNVVGRRRSKNNHNTAEDEYNIFGSDQVTNESIVNELKQVQTSKMVVKLEIEDFVTSAHHSLLPVVKAVFTCDEREWKRIRFTDSFPVSEFLWWQGLKHMVMREYETTLPDHLLEFLTVEAQIIVNSTQSLLPLLKTIPQDEDVVGFGFGGAALDGVAIDKIPEELEKVMSDNMEITIRVVCGWQDEEAEEDTEWMDLCKECKSVLENSKGGLKRPALTRNKSAPAQARPATAREAPKTRDAPVRMPSRRLQRKVSGDALEEAAEADSNRRNSDPDVLEDGSNMDASTQSKLSSSRRPEGGVPRMPSRGARRGTLSRQTPERAKSMCVLPSKSSSAADRLAMLGASGSRKVGSRRVPDGRSVPERSASGRRTPTRTSSRKIPDGEDRRLPARTNSRRAPPSRSSSRKVSRQEEESISNADANAPPRRQLSNGGEEGVDGSEDRESSKSPVRRTRSKDSQGGGRSPPRRTTSGKALDEDPDYNWAQGKAAEETS